MTIENPDAFVRRYTVSDEVVQAVVASSGASSNEAKKSTDRTPGRAPELGLRRAHPDVWSHVLGLCADDPTIFHRTHILSDGSVLITNHPRKVLSQE